MVFRDPTRPCGAGTPSCVGAPTLASGDLVVGAGFLPNDTIDFFSELSQESDPRGIFGTSPPADAEAVVLRR
jgi:hypothetical protein